VNAARRPPEHLDGDRQARSRSCARKDPRPCRPRAIGSVRSRSGDTERLRESLGRLHTGGVRRASQGLRGFFGFGEPASSRALDRRNPAPPARRSRSFLRSGIGGAIELDRKWAPRSRAAARRPHGRRGKDRREGMRASGRARVAASKKERGRKRRRPENLAGSAAPETAGGQTAEERRTSGKHARPRGHDPRHVQSRAF